MLYLAAKAQIRYKNAEDGQTEIFTYLVHYPRNGKTYCSHYIGNKEYNKQY